MSGVRELLAVVLGLGLGVLLIAAPGQFLRASVFMGPQRRRRHEGPAGNDEQPFGSAALWLMRAFGVACLAVAGYVAYTNFL
jgi:hypothetical protein